MATSKPPAVRCRGVASPVVARPPTRSHRPAALAHTEQPSGCAQARASADTVPLHPAQHHHGQEDRAHLVLLVAPLSLRPSDPSADPASARRAQLNEYIALGVYGLTGLGVYASMSGGSSDKKVASEQVDPKQSATSKEEAAFLENFINDRGASCLCFALGSCAAR